ncbi:MAG: hypothetical protein KGH84_09165, partial [Paracoccaceae bacterium]|nr:hypothetical protein [Paracoccaceae bacterium]
QLALTALLTEQEKRAKEASGKIITGAADYVAGQIRNTVQPVLKETVDTVRGLLGNAQAHAAETQDHVASAQAALVAAQALRRSSAVLAVVTVLAAAVAVAATLVAVTH